MAESHIIASRALTAPNDAAYRYTWVLIHAIPPYLSSQSENVLSSLGKPHNKNKNAKMAIKQKFADVQSAVENGKYVEVAQTMVTNLVGMVPRPTWCQKWL